MALTEDEYTELDELRSLGWASSTAAQRKRRSELLDRLDASGE